MTSQKDNVLQAVDLLKMLSHPVRLWILCNLHHMGEMSVGAIIDTQDGAASQSQISQFLASMRDQGLVTARRDGQVIYYSLSSDRAKKVIGALYDIFCAK